MRRASTRPVPRLPLRAPPRTLLAGAAAFVSLLLGVQAVYPPPLRAQTGVTDQNAGQVAELYREGMAAFNAGDYRRAAESMKAVLAKAPEGPALESIYYTLGAALYNLPDYPGAVDALNKFRAKYPRATRLTDATYALAQAHLATKKHGESVKLLAALEAVPTLRERVLLLEADALREDRKVDDTVAALRRLVGSDPRSPLAVQGALLLINSLTEKGHVAGAVATLTQLAGQTLDRPAADLARLRLVAGFPVPPGQEDKALAACDAILNAPTTAVGVNAVPRDIDAEAWVLKGKLLLGRKELQPALLAYLHLPTLYHDQRRLQPAALLGSGRAYVGRKDEDRTRRAFADLQTDFPGTAENTAAKTELQALDNARKKAAAQGAKRG